MKADKMTNNIKVARVLLEMTERGSPLAVAAVAEAAGVHYNDASIFLRVWAAGGWLDRRREGAKLIYSVTERGVKGLSRLIQAS